MDIRSAVTELVRIRAILVHTAGTSLVVKIRVQNLILETPDKSGSFDGEKHFHAAVQLAWH
jgi:hypothetical protein